MPISLPSGFCVQHKARLLLEIHKPSSTCGLEKAGPGSMAFKASSVNARLGSIATQSKCVFTRTSMRSPGPLPMAGSKVIRRLGSVCMAKPPRVGHFETTEERIARLVEVNKKLIARLAELEATLVQFKGGNSIRQSNRADSVQLTPNLGAESEAETATVVVENTSSFKSLEKAPLIGDTDVQTLLKVAKIGWPSPNDEVPFWKRKKIGNKAINTTNNASRSGTGIQQDSNPVYVVHITAEMAPVAKVGGLGDVVTGLGRACLERGHKVLVILPFYECIDNNEVEGLTEVESYTSYHKGFWVSVKTFQGKVSGVPVLLIQPVNQFFKGPSIYGGAYDEMEAYLFFCRASLERIQVTGDQPDIIHIHEWHLSAVAMLYWDMYYQLSIKKPRIILTIHNMEHYGECSAEQINMCGLNGSVYRTIDKAVDERTIGHNPERLSLLKGGIVYSNAITTVSPTYANETLCSGWMANTLLKHRSKYSGILNGIDTVLWDPSNDPSLPMGYGAWRLFGKQVCKQYIQRGLGLEPDHFVGDKISAANGKRSPLAICITRLVAQKGIHLIRHAINRIGERGGQLVLLGTAPDPRVQAEFESLARQFEGSKNIRLLLFYSEELAHMLYAAGDIVLVPSMFEPCGLTQMIGMRYGAIPIVRRTGGLADTVFDVDDHKNQDGKANGFVFNGITEDSFDGALNRALSYYQQRPEWWADLTSQAMEVDYSWNKSAQEYVALYNSIRVSV